MSDLEKSKGIREWPKDAPAFMQKWPEELKANAMREQWDIALIKKVWESFERDSANGGLGRRTEFETGLKFLAQHKCTFKAVGTALLFGHILDRDTTLLFRYTGISAERGQEQTLIFNRNGWRCNILESHPQKDGRPDRPKDFEPLIPFSLPEERRGKEKELVLQMVGQETIVLHQDQPGSETFVSPRGEVYILKGTAPRELKHGQSVFVTTQEREQRFQLPIPNRKDEGICFCVERSVTMTPQTQVVEQMSSPDGKRVLWRASIFFTRDIPHPIAPFVKRYATNREMMIADVHWRDKLLAHVPLFTDAETAVVHAGPPSVVPVPILNPRSKHAKAAQEFMTAFKKR